MIETYKSSASKIDPTISSKITNVNDPVDLRNILNQHLATLPSPFKKNPSQSDAEKIEIGRKLYKVMIELNFSYPANNRSDQEGIYEDPILCNELNFQEMNHDSFAVLANGYIYQLQPLYDYFQTCRDHLQDPFKRPIGPYELDYLEGLFPNLVQAPIKKIDHSPVVAFAGSILGVIIGASALGFMRAYTREQPSDATEAGMLVSFGAIGTLAGYGLARRLAAENDANPGVNAQGNNRAPVEDDDPRLPAHWANN